MKIFDIVSFHFYVKRELFSLGSIQFYHFYTNIILWHYPLGNRPKWELSSLPAPNQWSRLVLGRNRLWTEQKTN